MQRLKDEKREHISAVAAHLFATRPFHKVRLEDVAAAAAVGKGTLYVYFQSKEDLYFSLIEEGMGRVMEQLGEQSADENVSPRESLRRLVAELAAFAFAHPDFFELLRTVGPPQERRTHWRQQRERLTTLVEEVIRRGNRRGEFCDPHPHMTALFVPGMIRAVMLFPPAGLTENELAGQILRLLERGIVKE